MAPLSRRAEPPRAQQQDAPAPAPRALGARPSVVHTVAQRLGLQADLGLKAKTRESAQGQALRETGTACALLGDGDGHRTQHPSPCSWGARVPEFWARKPARVGRREGWAGEAGAAGTDLLLVSATGSVARGTQLNG